MKKPYPSGPKSTWLDQAKAVEQGKIVVTEDDIPMLLEWLKDMNWPGSDVIAQYLLKFESALIGPIKSILSSGDDLWIYWVLSTYADEFESEFWNHLIVELEEIAKADDEEGANMLAQYTLNR